MGELRQRGKIWWLRYYRNGLRHEESSRSTKKGEAERLLKLREGDIAKGAPITSKMGRMTFDEAITDLLNDYAVNARKSEKDVRRKIEIHMTPVFGGRRMTAITTADVRAYAKTRLESKAQPGQINRELAALKRAFTLAVQAGKLLARPHIPLLAEKNVRSGFFEAEQIASILAHLPVYARPAVEFAYITGWRMASEVLTLEWRNVDFASGEVRIDAHASKNGKPRVFVMTKRLRELLADVQTDAKARTRETGAIRARVFLRPSGEVVRGFRQSWARACKAAGCPGRLVHDLRRTAVRNLVRASIPERVAMEMTGHRTRSVFERYNITSAGDLRDAARRLDAVANATGTKQGQSSISEGSRTSLSA